ncbi:MAG: hypothetical protein VZR54_02385 [Ruminococcus sp.]|nr:hypothetical protein [Ruminococcus sp.]
MKNFKKVIGIFLSILITASLFTAVVPSASAADENDGFYLVGNINGDNSWGDNIHSELCFAPNEAADGEYMLSGVELSEGDALKVVAVEGGVVTTWYPGGTNNDYQIETDGSYTIYFRPDGQGGFDWHEGYFYVDEYSEGSGEGGSEEPDPGYYLVGNINGDNSWDDNIHTELCFVPNEEADGEYMLSGVELSAGDSIKVAEYKDGMVTWYPDGFENDYGIEADGLYTIYFRPDGQGGEDWHEGYFYVDEYSEGSGEGSGSGEGGSEEPDPGYYLVGNINGDNSWDDNIHTELCFVPNEEADGEYMLSGVELSAGDSIKVAEYKDGMVTWYPDGFDNDYGIEADGLYTIYFRPDGQGGEDWHEGYFYVDEYSEGSGEGDTTEPVETDPEGDTTEPVETDPEGDTTEPIETDPEGDTTEPVETDPEGDTTEPVETDPEGDTTEPVETNPVVDTTEPIETNPVVDTTEVIETTATEEETTQATETTTSAEEVTDAPTDAPATDRETETTPSDTTPATTNTQVQTSGQDKNTVAPAKNTPAANTTPAAKTAKTANNTSSNKNNPAKITKSNKTVKASKLSKGAVTYKAIKVKKAKGKVTYYVIKQAKKKVLTLKKKGKVKIKKGAAKGKYTLTVLVIVRGNKGYAPKTKTVKITVRVI